MRKLLSMAVLAIFTLSMAQAQTADEVISKYVSAIGGAAKWKAVKSQKSDITVNQMGMDLNGVITGDDKNRQRLEIEFQGMKMIQAYDGTTAWGINGFMGQTSASKLPEAEADAMKKTEFLDEMIDYKKRGFTATLEGEETIEGTACYVVKMTKKDGSEKMHYFDKETGLKTAEMEMVNGQELLTVMEEYEEQDGLVSPSKITQKSGGAVVVSITINNTERNIAVTDDLFAYPGN